MAAVGAGELLLGREKVSKLAIKVVYIFAKSKSFHSILAKEKIGASVFI